MAEPVMAPVTAILLGALMIAFGIYSAATTPSWIRIVVSIGGVATILVGLVMLVGLAKENKSPPDPAKR